MRRSWLYFATRSVLLGAPVLIWQTGSLFYSDDFLPGPVTTFAGAGKLVASGELFRDILISMQRVLKGWLLGGNRLSDLHIKTLL